MKGSRIKRAFARGRYLYLLGLILNCNQFIYQLVFIIINGHLLGPDHTYGCEIPVLCSPNEELARY